MIKRATLNNIIKVEPTTYTLYLSTIGVDYMINSVCPDTDEASNTNYGGNINWIDAQKPAAIENPDNIVGFASRGTAG